MSTSLISKRIQKTTTAQTNESYAKALFAYMLNPEAVPSPDTETVGHREKCVYSEVLGFSRDGLSPEALAMEVGTLCRTVDGGDQLNLVSHWVMSWKAGPNELGPAQEEIIAACKDHRADLGYGDDHLSVLSIHFDKENVHVHRMDCRMSMADGKILQEGAGWWKLESQRANARIASKYGWDQALGALFQATGELETVTTRNKFTGEVSERQRAVVKPAPKGASGGKDKQKPIRSRAWQQEQRTGLKSGQRLLREVLAELKPHIDPKMKWGDLHKMLAENGVESSLREHGQRQGLSYSLGEHWEKAGDLDPAWSLESLEKLLGKPYRKPREKVHTLAEAVRKEFPMEPTVEAVAKTPFSKEQVSALRAIPPAEVRERLGVRPTANPKVKNGLDVVIHEMKRPYAEAVKTLADAFPEILSGEGLIIAVPEESFHARFEKSCLPKSLERAAREIMREIDAFGCERFHVFTGGDAPGARSSSKKEYPEGMTQADLWEKLPYYARLNTDKGAHLYLAPVHGQGRISIPVDDVQDALLKKFRPSLLLGTSWTGRQGHYVIERKYEDSFYNWLAKSLNTKYGDPKVTTFNHDTRLAGFTNRKGKYRLDDGKYPFVKVLKSTPVRCVEFERYVDEQHKVWLLEQREKPAPASALTEDAAEIVRVRAEIWNLGIERQSRILESVGHLDFDHSKADWMVSKDLVRAGASVDEIYSFQHEHMLQKHDSQKAKDRQARRLAVRAMESVVTERAERAGQAEVGPVAVDPPSAWERRERAIKAAAAIPETMAATAAAGAAQQEAALEMASRQRTARLGPVQPARQQHKTFRSAPIRPVSTTRMPQPPAPDPVLFSPPAVEIETAPIPKL